MPVNVKGITLNVRLEPVGIVNGKSANFSEQHFYNAYAQLDAEPPTC